MSRAMRNPAFCIFENKDADQLRSDCAVDPRICFATKIVQSLFYLNSNFPDSSHQPGRKPRRPVFSRHGSNEGGQKFDPRVRYFHW